MLEKIKNIGEKILWTIIEIIAFIGIVVLLSLPGVAIGMAVARIINTFH